MLTVALVQAEHFEGGFAEGAPKSILQATIQACNDEVQDGGLVLLRLPTTLMHATWVGFMVVEHIRVGVLGCRVVGVHEGQLRSPACSHACLWLKSFTISFTVGFPNFLDPQAAATADRQVCSGTTDATT